MSQRKVRNGTGLELRIEPRLRRRFVPEREMRECARRIVRLGSRLRIRIVPLRKVLARRLTN